MNKFITALAAAGFATLVTGAAHAQGLGSYSGPYAGLAIGYGTLTTEGGTAAGVPDGDASGFDLVGFVGYEFREERLYYAGELELNASMKEDNNFEKGVGFALNGRVGYFLTDGTLLYGLLGFEAANVEYTGAPAGTDNAEETILGLRLGAGAEFRATDQVSIRAEYVYTIYEEAALGSGTDLDVTDGTFRVGGVYRFQL